MAAYLNMWKNYRNFTGRTTVSGFWAAILVDLLVALLLFLTLQINPLFILALFLYGFAVVVPKLSMTVRRLRDAGKPWYFFFCSFIPIIGAIILIYLLCRPSAQEMEG